MRGEDTILKARFDVVPIPQHDVCAGELAKELKELMEEENSRVVLIADALLQAAEIHFK